MIEVSTVNTKPTIRRAQSSDRELFTHVSLEQVFLGTDSSLPIILV